MVVAPTAAGSLIGENRAGDFWWGTPAGPTLLIKAL